MFFPAAVIEKSAPRRSLISEINDAAAGFAEIYFTIGEENFSGRYRSIFASVGTLPAVSNPDFTVPLICHTSLVC